ncbi:hypothetical protein D9M72_517220 [compost metagenome]
MAKEMFLAAIDADPAYARGYLGLAWLEIRKLKWNERVDMKTTLANAFAWAGKALERSPHDADVHWALGVVHLWRREAERAIGCYERGRELAPNNCDLLAEYCDALGYLGLLAATYAQLGRLEGARRAAAELLKLNPEFSIERYSARAPYRDTTLLARYVEGLRLAGLPA